MCQDKTSQDPCHCCPEIFLVESPIIIHNDNELRFIKVKQRGVSVDVQRPDETLVLNILVHDDRTQTITVYDDNVLPFIELSNQVRLVQRPDGTPVIITLSQQDTKLKAHLETAYQVSIPTGRAKKMQPVTVGVGF
ncbi:hypothetical protein [Argonema antarcticum]|uniref:hypothetical protein n=1 Tax=Argonema antarcticum TaxID=2942763 RepID=UPI002012108E|nr:hypothetical protein [Argonema antarcticum]MCL1471889.1 hypothetical protein [Argonema antarcticum A004/B2]